MLEIQNVVIDDRIKPAIEWIHGKAVQKQMPTDLHAILQLAFARFLDDWTKANDFPRGRVGTEWRFLVPPNSFETESVVPDVAFLATYFDLPKNERTYPAIPPDIAVEILSPGDDLDEVETRRKFFLWWGVKLVLIVDTKERMVEAHDFLKHCQKFGEAETLTTPAFASLAIPLQPIFAELDEPA